VIVIPIPLGRFGVSSVMVVSDEKHDYPVDSRPRKPIEKTRPTAFSRSELVCAIDIYRRPYEPLGRPIPLQPTVRKAHTSFVMVWRGNNPRADPLSLRVD